MCAGILCFCGSSRQLHVSPTLRIQTTVVDGFFYNPDKAEMTPVTGESVVTFRHDGLVLRCVDHVIQLSCV